MRNRSRLAELTLRDMQRIHLAMRNLKAIYDAINASSLQAKPAISRLILQADEELDLVFMKGALGIKVRVDKGHAPRPDLGEDFLSHVAAILQARFAGVDASVVAPEDVSAASESTDGIQTTAAPESRS